jgi:hypothetical protein
MDALDSLSHDVLQTMLAEAIMARHNLITQPSSVSSNNRSMNTFGKRLADADAYIARLKGALDRKRGAAAPGPIYVTGGR